MDGGAPTPPQLNRRMENGWTPAEQRRKAAIEMAIHHGSYAPGTAIDKVLEWAAAMDQFMSGEGKAGG